MKLQTESEIMKNFLKIYGKIYKGIITDYFLEISLYTSLAYRDVFTRAHGTIDEAFAYALRKFVPRFLKCIPKHRRSR